MFDRSSRAMRGFAGLLLLCGAASSSAITTTLDVYTEIFGDPEDPGDQFAVIWRGQYSATGAHPANARALAGNSNSDSRAPYNAFFVFDLSGVPDGTIVSAKLRLQVKKYWVDDNPGTVEDPYETFSVHDVAESAENVFNTSNDPAIFADLGASAPGELPYGSGTVQAGDAGTIVEVELSSRALGDLMSASGKFVFGVGLDTLSGDVRQEGILFAEGNEWIGAANPDDRLTHQLVLEILPVPDGGGTALIFGGAAAMLGMAWRRRGEIREKPGE